MRRLYGLSVDCSRCIANSSKTEASRSRYSLYFQATQLGPGKPRIGPSTNRKSHVSAWRSPIPPAFAPVSDYARSQRFDSAHLSRHRERSARRGRRWNTGRLRGCPPAAPSTSRLALMTTAVLARFCITRLCARRSHPLHRVEPRFMVHFYTSQAHFSSARFACSAFSHSNAWIRR
jgi:hypothetical protein